MKQIQAKILSNKQLQGDYFQLDMCAPEIAQEALPGQFVHVQIPDLEHRVLRRPFSIYDTDPATGRLSLVYKTVGEGTYYMSTLQKGLRLDILTGLGNGFNLDRAGRNPLLIGGGTGVAPLYYLAKCLKKQGNTDVHRKADTLYFLNRIQQSERQPETCLQKQLPPV